MKYKVGDKVRIKNKEWYEDNCNRYGILECGDYEFFEPMNEYCGEVVTITRVDDCYRVNIDKGAFCWTDEMFEGLVEEENNPMFKKGDCVKCSDGSCGIIVTCDWSDSLNCYQYYIDYIGTLDAGYQPEKDLQLHTITTMNGRDIFEGAKWRHEFECPEGYIFKDENGNVIDATKIVLEKKKKTKYPKTYQECCKVLHCAYEQGITMRGVTEKEGELFRRLIVLKRCRDAYWKIAGEELGLGKPWEPDFDNLSTNLLEYIKIDKGIFTYTSKVFVFPTREMRDAFKENFDPDIEICKELL